MDESNQVAEAEAPAVLNRLRLASLLLTTAAVGVGALSTAWGVVSLSALFQSEAASAEAFLAILLWLVTSLAGAVLLWGFAEVIRRFDEYAQLQAERFGRALPSASEVNLNEHTMFGTDGGDRARSEIIQLLEDLRDISLLDDSERSGRRQQMAEASVARLQREVPELLRGHNWVEARQRVLTARRRFPGRSEWDLLDGRIEQVRAGVEAHDVETAQRQVEDLAALDALDRASDVVRHLLKRHPESAAAHELAKKVQALRGKADAEKRARLMTQAQESAAKRDWASAYNAANTLIQQYPDSQEAAALRLDLPTLAANAEIQTRKRLESEIAELTRRSRFAEAYRLAIDLTERYPNSPQATVLRQQLPRLEQLARAGR